ncbi:multiprotein-bridging factor 1 family protein [Candidatus Poseidoniaceae archaeon]|nr:multiprotein-bridging factor 1 family protein [Candidatus Poseidoniaceae archaeon]
MADCELCGAMKVSTRSVLMGKAEVQACKRCTDKMGLDEKKVAPGLSQARKAPTPTSGGYSGQGRKGKDIMLRGEKELASDFSRRVSQARNSKGWDKHQLARKMAEKVNIISNVESGKRPTDAVIRKLERTLGITLMVEATPDQNRHVNSGDGRGLTLGDFLLGGKE